MEDLQNQKSQIEEKFSDARTQVRNASPFLYDVVSRAGKGALVGGFIGAFFFRSHAMRRTFALYGLGVGLGMNYSTMHSLSNSLFNTEQTNEEQFYAQIDSLQRELELRNKLK